MPPSREPTSRRRSTPRVRKPRCGVAHPTGRALPKDGPRHPGGSPTFLGVLPPRGWQFYPGMTQHAPPLPSRDAPGHGTPRDGSDDDTDLRADIRAAKKQMRVKFGGRRELRKLPSHMWEGEKVVRLTTGTYGKGQGLLVLTNRRLLFMFEGLLSKSSEDFPLDKISSVSAKSGVIMGTITIFASGNRAEIGLVQKHDCKDIVDYVRAHISAEKVAPPRAAAPAAHAPSPQVDVMAQLRQLGELTEAGILTQDEFDAKKVELLRRL